MKKPKSAHVPGKAIVTGGASGIGLATAEHLIEKGWKVAIFDANAAAVEAARKAFGRSRDMRAGVLDVTDERAVERAAAETAEAFGGITGVVNCAGIALDRPSLETTPEQFRKILDVNVVGTFLVSKAVARIMKGGKGGSIVNMGSISGLRGSKGRVAYGASKGAIVTLTQVMANELARHAIRVNAIAPGPVETPMIAKLHTDADRRLYGRFVPMRRYAKPGEIATAVHFLLDPSQSSYVTGEILAVDGGYRGAGLIVDD